MSLLEIKNLQAHVEDKDILKGVNLRIEAGETVALMGPNGSGKSSLASVLVGHPQYEVTGGSVMYNNQDLLAMKPEARARAGLFLSWQYPRDIAGVTLGNFMRLAYNATHENTLSVKDFLFFLKQKLDLLKMPHDFIMRSVNEGFSGGEKKRAEMLQLAVLEPRLAILDEVDSGLDVDALKIVTAALQAIKRERPELTLLIITHYDRVLEALPPDRVAIMRAGKVVSEGGHELVSTIQAHGYEVVV